MSDDKKRRGSPDSKRIDIHDPAELRNWSKSIGASQEEIKQAVKQVGTSAAKVRALLKGKK